MPLSRLVTIASALVLYVGAAVAEPSDDLLELNIEVQPVGRALNQLAQQARIQVVYSRYVVANLTSRELKGAYRVTEALARLLDGHGLAYEFVNDTTVAIRKAPAQDGSTRIAVPSGNGQGTRSKPRAFAEDPPGFGLEEIVVTAQKRQENLQDTPISISVVGEDALKNQGISRLTDFVDGAVPSLRLSPYAGRASAIVVGMRGISPGDVTQLSRDTTVGVYIDGVYLGRVQGLGTEMLDVERIEVLKGPQGTLFGRNAVGGAIQIVSKKPSGEFGLTQTAGVRNYDGFNSVTHLDLPAFAGFSVKLDATYSKRGGTIDNTLPGYRDFNEYERKGARAAVRWRPLDGLTADYAFDVSRDESTSGFWQLLSLFPGAPPLAPVVQPREERADSIYPGVPTTPSVGKTHGHTLNVSWEATSELELRSISAYRSMSQSGYDNSGASFFAFVPNGLFGRDSRAFVDQDQFSQEFQAVGTHKRLTYVAGLYYIREEGEDAAWAPRTMRWNATGTAFTVLPAPSGGPFPDRASNIRATSRAAFGQVTYTPPIADDRLHVTVGGRYTNDRKHGALTSIRGVDPRIAFQFNSSRFDPAATVAFDASEAVNVYAKWGTAYRAGGANSRSSTFRTFGPEEVETFELGIKTELWDRRARVNIAAYYTDYSHLQMNFNNPADPSSGETTNTDQPATIKGLEFDAMIKPLPHLSLGLSYAYTDAHIPPQLNPFTGLKERVNVVYTPKTALSGTVAYDVPRSFGTLHLSLSANAADGYYVGVANDRTTDASLTVNARLALSEVAVGSVGRLEVALWGKNLADEQHRIYEFPLRGTGLISGWVGVFNEPRTYGLEATMRF